MRTLPSNLTVSYTKLRAHRALRAVCSLLTEKQNTEAAGFSSKVGNNSSVRGTAKEA